MKHKIFLTSAFAMCAIAPAMATPTNTSSTFPNDELMQADYTYTNQATYPNTGVYDGNVTAQAQYDWTLINLQPGYWLDAGSTTPETCVGEYYCPGATGIHYDSENYQGIFDCTALGDGSYNRSVDGATSENDCYKDCTLAVANIAHAAVVSGRDYYGTGVDTCTVTLCEAGYHVNNGTCVANTINITWNGATAAAISANNAGTCTYGGDIRTPQTYDSTAVPTGKHFVGWKFVKSETFNLASLYSQIGASGTAASYLNGSGTYETGDLDGVPVVAPNTYGLTESNTWGVTFSYGKIIGEAKCSSQSAEDYTTSTTVSDTTGTNCWCHVTGFDDGNGVRSVATVPWVLQTDDGNECTEWCAAYCAWEAAPQGFDTMRRGLYGLSND